MRVYDLCHDMNHIIMLLDIYVDDYTEYLDSNGTVIDNSNTRKTKHIYSIRFTRFYTQI